MSTRGCVAVAQGDGWKGVYNHFDSYPTVLGKEVWRVVHEAKDFEAFVNKLLQFDDWRAYLKAGLCPYCGKVMPTAPHSIRGDDAMAVQGGAKAPDPEARHHDHSAEVRHITSEEDNGDTPLFIEWVYVLSPRQLTVLKSAPTAEHYELTVRGETVQRRRYGWELLVSLSLDGPEPDWQAMEKQGYDLVERRHQEVGS